MPPWGKDPDNPNERQRRIPGNGDTQDDPNDEDTGEHEAEPRRHQLRRQSDVRAYSQADGARVIIVSPKMLVVFWGIVTSIVPAAIAVVFWLGGQVLSPREAINSVKKEAAATRETLTVQMKQAASDNRALITSQGIRIDAAEQAIRAAQSQIDLNTYLNCVTVRYIDARLEPPDCRAPDVRQYRPPTK